MEETTDLLKKWENNFKDLQAKDAEAKAAGSIVGRFIYEPYADGRAYYVVIKEKKETVDIKVVTGIGDDWRIPYWGEKATVRKSYVLANLKRRDALEELFKENAV